jgi:hypothetical protein
MVDGTIAAYSGSLTYTAQISGAQETSSISLVEQENVAAITTASGTSYGAAVTLSISTSTSSTSSSAVPGLPAQDGEQALSTLKQTAAEAKGFLKKDAQQKLQIAEGELKLLKLLGGTDGARQAAQLARQIADAASQYAEGSDPSAPDQAASDADAAAAATATASTSAAASTADPSSAATVDAQPSFYQQVDAALAALRKYLQKILPTLAVSPDRDVRKTGETAKAEFDQAVAAAEAAEAEVDGQGSTAAFQPVDISA